MIMSPELLHAKNPSAAVEACVLPHHRVTVWFAGWYWPAVHRLCLVKVNTETVVKLQPYQRPVKSSSSSRLWGAAIRLLPAQSEWVSEWELRNGGLGSGSLLWGFFLFCFGFFFAHFGENGGSDKWSVSCFWFRISLPLVYYEVCSSANFWDALPAFFLLTARFHFSAFFLLKEWHKATWMLRYNRETETAAVWLVKVDVCLGNGVGWQGSCHAVDPSRG